MVGICTNRITGRGLLGFDDIPCFPGFYVDNTEYEPPLSLELNPSITLLDPWPISLHFIEPQ